MTCSISEPTTRVLHSRVGALKQTANTEPAWSGSARGRWLRIYVRIPERFYAISQLGEKIRRKERKRKRKEKEKKRNCQEIYTKCWRCISKVQKASLGHTATAEEERTIFLTLGFDFWETQARTSSHQSTPFILRQSHALKTNPDCETEVFSYISLVIVPTLTSRRAGQKLSL